LKKIKLFTKTIRNNFKIGSIQSVITLSFTAITLLAMIFIGIAFYSTFSKNAKNNASSSVQQIMNQATINLEYYLRSMIDITDLIQQELVDTPISEVNTLKPLLYTTLKIRKDLVSLAIYSSTGSLLLTSPDYSYNPLFTASEQNWFYKSLTNPDLYLFQPPHVQRLFKDKRPWVASLSHGIIIEDDYSSYELVTKVDMNFSIIEQLCDQVTLGKRGYIYIIDSEGNIIYHPQQQLIYAGLKKEDISGALLKGEGSYINTYEGEQRMTTIKDINYANWKMVGVSFVDEIVENSRNFNFLIIIILLFGVVFITISSIFISSKISRPIKRLERQMNRIEKGDFNIENLEAKGEDEVKRLTRAFNLMIAKIKKLMDQIILEQEAKRKSELKALQTQINPHFLYNTLDSIIWMNENGNHEGVTDMVSALAKFFRISISKGNETISVCDEIEHARSYLIIQKIRYKNKYDFTIDIPENICKYKTIKLLLQPIIENAIYHGITHIQEKGLINISVFIEDNAMIFKVVDNGYGIKKEKLKEILLQEVISDHSSGVGLKNVNERIKLFYGEKYGISISSEFEVGTTVKIVIPLIKE